MSETKSVWIQMSCTRSICGVWDHEPTDEERTLAYDAYMSQPTTDVAGNVGRMKQNTFVLEKDLLP